MKIRFKDKSYVWHRNGVNEAKWIKIQDPQNFVILKKSKIQKSIKKVFCLKDVRSEKKNEFDRDGCWIELISSEKSRKILVKLVVLLHFTILQPCICNDSIYINIDEWSKSVNGKKSALPPKELSSTKTWIHSSLQFYFHHCDYFIWLFKLHFLHWLFFVCAKVDAGVSILCIILY